MHILVRYDDVHHISFPKHVRIEKEIVLFFILFLEKYLFVYAFFVKTYATICRGYDRNEIRKRVPNEFECLNVNTFRKVCDLLTFLVLLLLIREQLKWKTKGNCFFSSSSLFAVISPFTYFFFLILSKLLKYFSFFMFFQNYRYVHIKHSSHLAQLTNNCAHGNDE